MTGSSLELRDVDQTGLKPEGKIFNEPDAQAGRPLRLLQEAEGSHLRLVGRARKNLFRARRGKLAIGGKTVMEIGKGRFQPAPHIVANGVTVRNGEREAMQSGGLLRLLRTLENFEIRLTPIAPRSHRALGNEAETDAAILPTLRVHNRGKDHF